jgi:hypothetical protein
MLDDCNLECERIENTDYGMYDEKPTRHIVVGKIYLNLTCTAIDHASVKFEEG